MTALYILIGLIVLVALYVIVTYNALVSLRVRVGEAWSDIEVQMKRRYNLIESQVVSSANSLISWTSIDASSSWVTIWVAISSNSVSMGSPSGKPSAAPS